MSRQARLLCHLWSWVWTAAIVWEASVVKAAGRGWGVGGRAEVERNANLTDMHNCCHASEHCLNSTAVCFSGQWHVSKMTSPYVMIMEFSWADSFFHAHILYQLPPCEWLCGIQLMVSDSSSILWVWSSLWLIWIQSPLTGLFSTGVYCSESDYNDSLLRKMVFHSIEGS